MESACLSGSDHSLKRCFFFFNDTATTEIYTLSLHDALPISAVPLVPLRRLPQATVRPCSSASTAAFHSRFSACHRSSRSEEHTSELQSRQYLVCRLLLEKKNKKIFRHLNCDHY